LEEIDVEIMSKKIKDDKDIEIRFIALKDTKIYDAVLFFEKNYKLNTRSKTIQLTLTDFKTLFDFFNVRTFEGLIKKIGIKVSNNVKTF